MDRDLAVKVVDALDAIVTSLATIAENTSPAETPEDTTPEETTPGT